MSRQARHPVDSDVSGLLLFRLPLRRIGLSGEPEYLRRMARMRVMDKEVQFKKFFRLTSLITDIFPSGGSKFLDFALINMLSNPIVRGTVSSQAHRRVRGIESVSRILVAADLNIGDAIIVQAVILGLKEIFPGAEIDCVIKKSANDLIMGNPNIANLFPVYTSAPYPSEKDLKELAAISSKKDYDLVINFSPMIDDSIFRNPRVVNYTIMAAALVRNEKIVDEINNVVYQAHAFVGSVFRDRLPGNFGKSFKGIRVYLSDEAVEDAVGFLKDAMVSGDDPIVMFNPDASARFTRMPFELQLGLLRKLTGLDVTILLGAGHVEKYIEHELMYSLSPERRKKITVIPAHFKLDVYAALVDLADVFISGDTGPLHLAAARKFLRSSGRSLRNRTSIISVFGGTPPRIYGYDSEAPGFFPANQDAPSKTFVAENTCRNISCINKMAKTCREVRCFRGLQAVEIAEEARKHLDAVFTGSSRERLQILAK